jgi:hypothetical protein
VQLSRRLANAVVSKHESRTQQLGADVLDFAHGEFDVVLDADVEEAFVQLEVLQLGLQQVWIARGHSFQLVHVRPKFGGSQ